MQLLVSPGKEKGSVLTPVMWGPVGAKWGQILRRSDSVLPEANPDSGIYMPMVYLGHDPDKHWLEREK